VSRRFSQEVIERVAQALARLVAERQAEAERRDALRRREGPWPR
jgi:hypothetical protein